MLILLHQAHIIHKCLGNKAPATPPGKAMMRNSFMATHEPEHLEYIVETYKKVGKQLGII